MYYFSTGGKFRLDYGLLFELHALTLVAHSYALLVLGIRYYVGIRHVYYYVLGYDLQGYHIEIRHSFYSSLDK